MGEARTREKTVLRVLLLTIVVAAVAACSMPLWGPPGVMPAPPTITPAPPTWTPVPPTPAPAVDPTAGRTPARVLRVVDGDTIVVMIDRREYRLRYIGIDTPETVHPELPVQWMGPEASAANKALVEGQTVYLEKDISEVDKYGRLLRYVFLEDGTFVNAELLRLGLAQVSTYPPDVKYVELYLQMQREAREAGRGMWGPEPTRTPRAGSQAPRSRDSYDINRREVKMCRHIVTPHAA